MDQLLFLNPELRMTSRSFWPVTAKLLYPSWVQLYHFLVVGIWQKRNTVSRIWIRINVVLFILRFVTLKGSFQLLRNQIRSGEVRYQKTLFITCLGGSRQINYTYIQNQKMCMIFFYYKGGGLGSKYQLYLNTPNIIE